MYTENNIRYWVRSVRSVVAGTRWRYKSSLDIQKQKLELGDDRQYKGVTSIRLVLYHADSYVA
jgi:hypothetical protein